MANNYETTTSFKVDISQLKSAMQEAKRAVSVANSEFKAVSSSMDDWSKSSDGLAAKLKQLDTNLKSQKTILANLEQQYELTVKEMGEGSAAADRLKVAINNQKAAINKTEREIAQYEQTLEEVSDAEKEAAKTGKTVSEVLDDVGESAEDAGDGFTTLKGAIATFAGNMLTQLVDGVKNGISAFMGLAEETREYRNEMAKLDTAFETAGFTARATEQTYKDLYAILGDEGQSVEAANMLAKLCDSQKDLSTWTNISAGVYGTFGASLPIESLAEAANETAKVGAVTGSLADALNWTGVTAEDLGLKLKANTKENEEWNKAIKEGASSEDLFNMALSECSTEQERQALITKTLNELYSEAADKYKETNKSVMDANRANSDYADTMAELGETIEPVTTAVKKGFTELINKAMQLVGDVDIDSFVKKIENGFGVLANEVLPAVKDGFGWIVDNKTMLLTALSGIAAGFAVFKSVTAISSAITAIKGLGSAMGILKAAMAAMGGPVTIVITIIGALVAAFITLWNTSDGFRAFWINLWEGIKDVCGKVAAAIAKFFTETIPAAIQSMVEWFKKLPEDISQWLTNVITSVSEWASNMKNQAMETGSKFLKNLVDFFKQLPEKLGNFLYQALVAITATLIALPILAYNHGKEFLEKLIEWFKQLPTKVAEWLQRTIEEVSAWASDMKEEAIRTAKNFVIDFIDFFADLYSEIDYQFFLIRKRVAAWATETITKGKQTAQQFVNGVAEFVKTLPDRMRTWLNDTLSRVVSWGSDLATKGKAAALDMVDAIVETISELPETVAGIGEDMVRGIWNGISSMGDWIENKIAGFVGDVESWLKKWFEIGSPSKLMAREVGRWLPEGIAVGIDKNAKSVLSSVKDLTANTVDAAKRNIAGNSRAVSTVASGSRAGVVNNFYQTINSPKQLSRLDIYRNSKNLLGYAGGVR